MSVREHLKQTALDIYAAALAAVDPFEAVNRCLSLEGENLQVQPLIASDEAGIHTTFLDGADLSLTVGGRTACSKCGPSASACSHADAALPYYTRWLWAQAIEGRWPAHRMAQLGIPPAAAQPTLVGVEPWRFLEPVVCGGATLYAASTSWADGCIVRFLDGGHVGRILVHHRRVQASQTNFSQYLGRNLFLNRQGMFGQGDNRSNALLVQRLQVFYP